MKFIHSTQVIGQVEFFRSSRKVDVKFDYLKLQNIELELHFDDLKLQNRESKLHFDDLKLQNREWEVEISGSKVQLRAINWMRCWIFSQMQHVNFFTPMPLWISDQKSNQARGDIDWELIEVLWNWQSDIFIKLCNCRVSANRMQSHLSSSGTMIETSLRGTKQSVNIWLTIDCFVLPMTDLRNMFIFRHFNISAKVANSLSVICTLCPINWVETRNDAPKMVPDFRRVTLAETRHLRLLQD